MMLPLFTDLLTTYVSDPAFIKACRMEIEKHYTEKSRHYHTLTHLQKMYEQLLPVKNQVADWDTLLFSLFYHDVIYKVTAKDNEERSAALAVKRLAQIGYSSKRIEKCQLQILATKTHVVSADTDVNYFTDADLSILGADWPEYKAYTKTIRKEYSIYPDLLYIPGRRKVLQHFLAMPQLFKTNHFKQKSEESARENLQEELRLLHL